MSSEYRNEVALNMVSTLEGVKMARLHSCLSRGDAMYLHLNSGMCRVLSESIFYIFPLKSFHSEGCKCCRYIASIDVPESNNQNCSRNCWELKPHKPHYEGKSIKSIMLCLKDFLEAKRRFGLLVYCKINLLDDFLWSYEWWDYRKH